MAVHISQPNFVPSAIPYSVLSLGQTLDDQVRCQIQNSSYPELRNIECDCHQGKLTLRGVVGSFFLKQAAQEALVHLPGVDHIDNRLEVVSYV